MNWTKTALGAQLLELPPFSIRVEPEGQWVVYNDLQGDDVVMDCFVSETQSEGQVESVKWLRGWAQEILTEFQTKPPSKPAVPTSDTDTSAWLEYAALALWYAHKLRDRDWAQMLLRELVVVEGTV